MSAPEAERLARVALCRMGEPGDLRMAGLVAAIGPVAVRDQLLEPRDGDELAADVAQRLSGLDPARDLALAARQGIRYVVPGDDEWPHQLDALDPAEPVGAQGGTPLGLWVRGPLHLAQSVERAVSVVGARSATTYGSDVAAEMALGLTQAATTVVSGGAVGIDMAAHRGALAGNGPTVAVMACGVDRPYPLTHRDVLEHLATTALLVSDLAPGCAPSRYRFLARNRIIAGLGLGTVVVEAARRSGAANTASWTDSLHRPVMGVPGPVTSATSVGVHHLIRARGAVLVTRAEEVLEVVAPAGQHLLVEPAGEHRPRDGLEGRDQQVLDALPVSRAAPVANIARAAGVAVPLVSESLERLVELGHAEGLEDGFRLAR